MKIIIGIAAIVAVIFFIIMLVYKRSTLKKWLLAAVETAENELGSGTG